MSVHLIVFLLTLHLVQVSAKWQRPTRNNRTVDVQQIENTFEDMLRRENIGDEQLAAIVATMQSTYNALPKNKFQRLTHTGTAYLVHDYFVRKYQWHFRGFSSGDNGMKLSEIYPRKGRIRQDMVPHLLEEMLQTRESGRGLTIADAAAMAATLHELVHSDSEMILTKAYKLRNLEVEKNVGIEDVPALFLAVAFTTNGRQLSTSFEKRLHNHTRFMDDFAGTASNVLRTMIYQRRHRTNPFVPQTFSFAEVLDLIERTRLTFGQWQESSCTAMRNHLVRLDPSGSGRVPLGTFYAQPDMGMYRFEESQEYLQETGGLDESVASRPQVLISNYVLGPGNCYSSSTYFQYCCINHCMHLMNEIETYVAGSLASPEEILYAVGNASAKVSVELAEQAQEIPEELLEKLFFIAQRHEGKVPLHGRLFAQWLHFAFPSQCPYPHVPKNNTGNNALTANDFLQSAADPKEMQRLIEASGNFNVSERTLSQWTDDETSTLMDPPRPASVRGVLRTLAVALAVVTTLVSLFRASQDASRIEEIEMDKVV